MILSSVTSSPDESLASNLQRETVLLRSLSAGSRANASGVNRPHWKKVCSDVSAAEVMGPVESGERMIAKKGPRRAVSGIVCRSAVDVSVPGTIWMRAYSPSTSFTVRLSSWKPLIKSCSLLPRSDVYCSEYCLVRRSPRLVASAESPLLKECVDIAHLEFLRITDVTERISDSRICFKHTDAGTVDTFADSEAMLGFRRVAFVAVGDNV